MSTPLSLSLITIVALYAGDAATLAAQRVVEEYEPATGVLRIGPEPDRAVPMVERGYTLIVPDGPASARGVVVFVDARRNPEGASRLEPGGFETEALHRDVAVLHITTGNPLDFLFEDEDVDDLANRIGAILHRNGLGQSPVFVAGLSLGGTRALRLVEFLRARREPRGMHVAAVAIVDAPLDMLRLWKAERRAAAIGFHPAAEDEGRWVSYLLEENLGGPPTEVRERYVEYSPFVFGERDGGNAVWLRDVPVRAYHEPDVNWWIDNRAKSYYSMNSLDLAALINELRLLGNADAELVSTYRQRSGYAEGASPHTWSIVDNADLVEWFLRCSRR